MHVPDFSHSNFDNSVQRIKMWVSDKPATSPGQAMSPSSSTSQVVGLGLTMAAGMGNAAHPDGAPPASSVNLTSSQRKRIKQYLKRCRMNPRHSQLNLEGYLLLPVQRIPRYRLLVSATSRCINVGLLLTWCGSLRNSSAAVRRCTSTWTTRSIGR